MEFSWLFFILVLIHIPKYIYSLENWEAVFPFLHRPFLSYSSPPTHMSTAVGSYKDQKAGIGSTECTVHNTL